MALIDIRTVEIELQADVKAFCAIDDNILVTGNNQTLSTYVVNHDNTEGVLEYTLLLESSVSVGSNVQLARMVWLQAASLILLLWSDGKLAQWDPYSSQTPQMCSGEYALSPWLLSEVLNDKELTYIALARRRGVTFDKINHQGLSDHAESLLDLPHTPRALSLTIIHKRPVLLMAYSMSDYALCTTGPLQIQHTINLSTNDVFGTGARIGASLSNYVTGLGSSRAPAPKIHLITDEYDGENVRWAVKTFSEWVELQVTSDSEILQLEENLKAAAPSNGLSAVMRPYVVILSNTLTGAVSECRLQAFSQDSLQTMDRTTHEFSVVQLVSVPNTRHILCYCSDKHLRLLKHHESGSTLETLEAKEAYYASSMLRRDGDQQGSDRDRERYALLLVESEQYRRFLQVAISLNLILNKLIGLFPSEVSSKWHVDSIQWRKELSFPLPREERPATPQGKTISPPRSSPKPSPKASEITEGLVRSRSSQFSLSSMAKAPKPVRHSHQNGYRNLCFYLGTLKTESCSQDQRTMIYTVHARLCILLKVDLDFGHAQDIDIDDIRELLITQESPSDLIELLRLKHRFEEAIGLISYEADLLDFLMQTPIPQDLLFSTFPRISHLPQALGVFKRRDIPAVRAFLRTLDPKLAITYTQEHQIYDLELAETLIDILNSDPTYLDQFKQVLTHLDERDILTLPLPSKPSTRLAIHTRLAQHDQALLLLEPSKRLSYAATYDCYLSLFHICNEEEKVDLLTLHPFSIPFKDALPSIRHVPAFLLKTYLLAQFI